MRSVSHQEAECGRLAEFLAHSVAHGVDAGRFHVEHGGYVLHFHFDVEADGIFKVHLCHLRGNVSKVGIKPRRVEIAQPCGIIVFGLRFEGRCVDVVPYFCDDGSKDAVWLLDCRLLPDLLAVIVKLFLPLLGEQCCLV